MGMQEQLNNLERGTGRIEGKVDGILSHLEKINGRLGTHGERLDKLDNEMTAIKTKATIFGGAAGTFVMVAWQFLKERIKL